MIIPCVKCEIKVEVPVEPAQVTLWREGRLIQDVMPGLAPEMREMLISRVCPTCWDAMFGEEF